MSAVFEPTMNGKMLHLITRLNVAQTVQNQIFPSLTGGRQTLTLSNNQQETFRNKDILITVPTY